MADNFSINEVETPESAVVLRIRGHLNAKSTPLLVERCKEIRESARSVVLNFSEVTFIASSGVGGMLALVEEFRDVGLSVRFAALSSVVESVIQLLNLESFLDIDGSEDESIEALKAA